MNPPIDKQSPIIRMSSRLYLIIAAFLLVPAPEITSQEEPSKGTLIVSRATVTNFIEDPIVTANLSKDEELKKLLPSTFVMLLGSTGQKIYWSPALCRMVAIGPGKRSSFREMVAEGAHPLSISLGAIGRPEYFGFRFVDGKPEFLYTYGQLSVEESYEISADGSKLFQRFRIQSNAIDGAFSLTENWRAVVTADNGEWLNNVLTLSREQLNEGFTITYHLDPNALP